MESQIIELEHVSIWEPIFDRAPATYHHKTLLSLITNMSLSKAEVVQRLQELDEYEFEQFIADLWERRGWNTSVTTATNDQGIDVIATRDEPYSEKELIQAKRYKQGNRIGGPELQQYGSLHHHGQDVDKVIVVTTSDFTDSALSEADKSNVKPINGRTLAQMVMNAGALDIVQWDTDEVGGDPEFPTSEPDTSSKEVSISQEPLTLLDDGSSLTAELVGLERVSLTASSSSFLRGSVEFEGVLAAFKLYNRSEKDLVIEEIEEFELTDVRGTTYSAANLGKGSFDDKWIKHGGRAGVDDGWIYAGAAKKYVVGFNTPESSRPDKISLDRYGIKFHFDHEIRQNISDLPGSITKSL